MEKAFVINKLRIISELMFDKNIRNTAIKLAFIVGPLLTLINQYDIIFGEGIYHLNWIKVSLSLFMPYAVSTFSAVKSKMSN